MITRILQIQLFSLAAVFSIQSAVAKRPLTANSILVDKMTVNPLFMHRSAHASNKQIGAGNTKNTTSGRDTVKALRWVYFQTYPKTGMIQLEWKTEEGSNLSHYRLERSSDGNNWNMIALVFAGNSLGCLYYYMDRQPLKNNFYRLCAVYPDGSMVVSSHVMAKRVKRRRGDS